MERLVKSRMSGVRREKAGDNFKGLPYRYSRLTLPERNKELVVQSTEPE